MRSRLMAMVFACCLALGLASCDAGSIGDILPQGDGQEAVDEALMGIPTYDVDSFEIDGWKAKITDAYIVFDERAGKDDLIVELEVVNGSSEPGGFVSVANIYAYQGERELRQANAVDENGEFYLDLDAFNEIVEAGKKADVMYGWELSNYETVEVIFTGFYEGSERTVVHFDVSTCQTEEAAAVEANAEAGLDAKHATKGARLEGAELEVVEPWFLDSSDATHAELRQDDSPAQLSVVTSDEQESAEAWAKRVRENYTSGSEVTTVRVGVNTFYCFYPTENQFQLFADCPDGKHAINIYGLFVTLDDASEQIKAIALLQSRDDDGEDEEDAEEGEDGEGLAEGGDEDAEGAALEEGSAEAGSDGYAQAGSSQPAPVAPDPNGMGVINDIGVDEGIYGPAGTSDDGSVDASGLYSEDTYYEDVYY